MKEKIAFSIDSSILKKVDSTVNGITIKSRSHALEILIRKALGEDEVKHAIILAGGEQKSDSYSTTRPMIRFEDKPILQHIIEWLKKFDITNITISVGYMREEIEGYFRDGKDFGVSIDYMREDEPLGTAGPLYLAKSRFRSTFIAIYADVLCDFNLVDMINDHRQSKAIATIALKEVKNPHKYGVANLEGRRITNFVQKPVKGKALSNIINAGVYIFEPEIFDYIPKRGMLETDVFDKLSKTRTLNGYIFSGRWIEVSDS
ncbi:MAG: nucleotidyltransferase family protein [Candidatus Micrarchaeota archaeon]